MNKVYTVNHLNRIFEYKLVAETNTRYVLETSHGTNFDVLKNRAFLTKKAALLKVESNLKDEIKLVEKQLNTIRVQLEELQQEIKEYENN